MTTSMRLLDDIYTALQAGTSANESLATWVTSIDGRDRIWSNARVMADGVRAFEELRRNIREGRQHIELPDHYEKPTSCQCSSTPHPPCSFCEP